MMTDVLDTEHLAELQFVLEEEYQAFIQSFIEDTDSKLEQLQLLVSEQRLQAGRDLAHSLKGSCLNLGAKIMAEQCHQLNITSNLADCDSQLKTLLSLWGETKAELRILATQ